MVASLQLNLTRLNLKFWCYFRVKFVKERILIALRGSQLVHLQSNAWHEPLTIHGIHTCNLYNLMIYALHVKGSTKNLPSIDSWLWLDFSQMYLSQLPPDRVIARSWIHSKRKFSILKGFPTFPPSTFTNGMKYTYGTMYIHTTPDGEYIHTYIHRAGKGEGRRESVRGQVV